MKKNSLKHILVATLAAVLAVLGSQSAFAQTYTWTDGDFNVQPNIWNDAGNWDINAIPNAPGVTATLTFPGGNLGNPLTVNLAATSETVGTLNIGTSDGVAGGTYLLESTGGGTLTLNNSGAGAAINEISTSVGDTISAPLVMADNLTITNYSTGTTSATGGLKVTGAITGTGNLTINNDSAVTGTNQDAMHFTGSTINNVGTLSFDGTTAYTAGDAVRIEGVIGSNVTSIIQNGASLAHMVGGETISGTETYINNGTANLNISEGAITGTGNLIIQNNTSLSGGIDFSPNGGTENNVGTITSSGTGTGQVNLGGVGSNVTQLINASTSKSILRVNSGTININTSGTTTLIDNSSNSGAGIVDVGGSTGTGNLVMQNNGTQSITLAQSTYNNTGEIINTGTGTGTDGLNSASPTIGANVTEVVEDSTTSAFEMRLGTETAFTGKYVVQAGTMEFDANAQENGVSYVVGDTAADGSGTTANSTLKLGWDSSTAVLALGATSTLSGFGTVTHSSNQSISTVSGSTIAPGSLGNIGKLTVNTAIALASGANLTFALGTAGVTPAAGISSMLVDGGTLGLTAGLNLNLSNNAGANGQGSVGAGHYELASYNSLTGATLGDISSMFNITGPSGFTYDLTDTSITGAGQIDLTVAVAAPEPGTWAMLLGGLGMFFGAQKLRSRRA